MFINNDCQLEKYRLNLCEIIIRVGLERLAASNLIAVICKLLIPSAMTTPALQFGRMKFAFYALRSGKILDCAQRPSSLCLMRFHGSFFHYKIHIDYLLSVSNKN
jgi:hypothetical protein